MPKAVQGFQIANGEFYESEEKAKYEETKLFLHTEAENAIQVTQQNFPAFLDFIELHPELIRDHCENYMALQNIVNGDDADEEELARMREGVSINGTDKE